jgi:hypothetical protein
MTYKIGDKIRMTTLTWGEAVQDRNGNVISQRPHVSTYAGTVLYVGPETATQSVEVVRCSGGNVGIKTTHGFSFYPKDNGPKQIVEAAPNHNGPDLRELIK